MINKFDSPLYVTKSTLPLIEEYIEIIRSIWENNLLTNNGPLHSKLEDALKDYLKINNITLFTNGHLALECAIKALNLDGEVITTPFTFVSTAHAISTNHLVPVFCDIKMSDYTIDETKIEELITEKTSAIIPVHVYGYPCNVEAIQKIADKYDLSVIYDAAHAFGVEINGIPVTEYGDLSMYSFHATKVFNTIEGGALAYSNSQYKHTLDLLKNFGIASQEDVSLIGINAKMNEFQAAMGLANLKTIDEKIQNRKIAYENYKKHLSAIPGLRMVNLLSNIKYNYSYMPILVDESAFKKTRDELYDALIEYNIFSRKYFYPLISNTEPYLKYKVKLPVAEYVSERILCLPLFGDITSAEVKHVCDVIVEIYQRKN